MAQIAGPSPTLLQRLHRLLFGRPVATEHADHSLLPKRIALPVFASDAISSVAYATQQIILALCMAGLGLAAYQRSYQTIAILVAIMVTVLLIVVVTSYRQTINAYQGGGGSYIVSKDNLGANAGLWAGAALLIDYVLTVSVSIAGGVQNLASIPFCQPLHPEKHLVLFCLLFIALLTFASLRGLKESGALFAVFTYGFIVMCAIMIVAGVVGPLLGLPLKMQTINDLNKIYPSLPFAKATFAFTGIAAVGLFLRAFANGCSAMTGVEAVSNGIPAFKAPKAKNAITTLVLLGAILGSIFIGISWLAVNLHVVYWDAIPGVDGAPAVIDQLSGAIFGKHGYGAIFYILTQLMTAGVLVLAANTSYADFPRLASIMSRDGYLPKQFSNLGDKLVFNNGIVILGGFAGLLIIATRGSVDSLIPLYSIGVFMAFTLSQWGMVMRWRRLKEKGWQQKAAVNGFGAITTAIVLLDVAYEKFAEGAWAVMILMAILVVIFKQIKQHYESLASQLSLVGFGDVPEELHNTVLLLVPSGC